MAHLDPNNPPDFATFGESIWRELTTLRFGETTNPAQVAEVAVTCALSQATAASLHTARETERFDAWADGVGL
ncbi:hypothetical protein [Kocuria salsicia]|uniref:hypothetical protein n=1 Tax=Kocuria salsicia TaxID=664639 RepID=UPI00119E482E|nr:hypothetical protein [Kocuria salsicia]